MAHGWIIFQNTGRGDLYEIALDKCLEAFDYVVAIIPETFLHSNYPKDRCAIVSILEKNPFEDTTFPVCVNAGSHKPSRIRSSTLEREK